jgi:hypothetical protein
MYFDQFSEKEKAALTEIEKVLIKEKVIKPNA